MAVTPTNVTGSDPTGATQQADQATKARSTKSDQIPKNTPIKDLAALKELSPEMYNEMMKAMGSEMTNDMRKHQENLKKLMREGEAKAQGR